MPGPSTRHIEPLLTLTGSDVPLEGTIAATSALSGTLTVTAATAGTITSTSTLTGTISVAGVNSLAGTITATSTLTGALTARAALAGTITTQSTLLGALTLTTSVDLSGTIASTSTLTGDLTNEEPPAHVPGLRYAIHWFWEPGNHSEMPATPKTCPECGAPAAVMSLDAEVFCRHYELGATDTNGTLITADCRYIATINDSNYAQPLPADILAGYVLTAPVA